MRCTRCDRPAVPQAVGRTPDGDVVFGWCLACLRATECEGVVVARSDGPKAGRRKREEWVSLEEFDGRESPDRSDSPERRHGIVGLIAVFLSAWGGGLLLAGLRVGSRVRPQSTSPFGNGTPALLIMGGISSLVVGMALGGVAFSRAGGSPNSWRRVRYLTLALAALAVAAGVIRHDPRRDPLVVVAVTACLGLSAAARWLERRTTAREVSFE